MFFATSMIFTAFALTSLATSTAGRSILSRTPSPDSSGTLGALTCNAPAGYGGSILDDCINAAGAHCNKSGQLETHDYVPGAGSRCREYCTCSQPTTSETGSGTDSASKPGISALPSGPAPQCPTMTLAGFGGQGDPAGGLNQSIAAWCASSTVGLACVKKSGPGPYLLQVLGTDSQNVCLSSCSC